MRITPNIAIIGSGRLGFGLTDPLDCNVYLVRCGNVWTMIDAGAGRDVDGLLRNARADGIESTAIRHVLLTHGHADHAGGCAELKRRLGAAVWASREVAGWLSSGDRTAISLDKAIAAGIYPADYRFDACPVDYVVEDNVPVSIGDTGGRTITPLATPGHADGHMAYLLDDAGRACVFVGDLLTCRGEVLLQFTEDCSVQKLGQSLLRLRELSVDALFPGHFHFCVSGGQAPIEAAGATLGRLLLPRTV